MTIRLPVSRPVGRSDPDRAGAGSHNRARAQSSVGTLVIFIAMVLVATMAAGVLFDTTGAMQGRASSTSDASASKIAARIDVVAVTGKVHRDTVEAVNLTVKSSTSRPVDMRDVTIRWIGPSGTVTATHAGEAGNADATFGVRWVEGDTGDHLLEGQDRAIVTLDPGTAVEYNTTYRGRTIDLEETGPALEPNDVVRMRLVTGSGATTDVRLRVPNPLPDGHVGF